MLLAPPPAHPGVDLVRRLASHGDADAIVCADGALSYSVLAGRVERAAAALGSGRRLVLVAATNHVDALVAHLAALWAGHVVLLAPGDRPATVTALTAAYDPDVVVGQRDGRWVVEHRHDAPAHVLHPDLSLLLTTSGSTGSPKVVRLSGASVQANAEAIAHSLDVSAADRAVTTLPMAYSYGLSVVHSHLLRGAALVLTDLSVTEPCFWDLVRRSRATSLAGVPYTFDLLDRVGFAEMDLPDLRLITQAGGAMDPSTVQRYAALGRRRGWDLRVMYGQTEATARMACQAVGAALEAPTSIGRPVIGGALQLADVDSDGVGELVYTGPNVMLGYAESPADLSRGRTVRDLRTGDLGRRRDDGTFEVVGRVGRWAKVFGQRIDLQHLEQQLRTEDVQASCLETEGGLLVAVEGVEGNVDAASLSRRIGALLGLPARVVQVIALPSLPRLPSGKPDLTALADVAPTAPRDERSADLCALYAAVLGRDDVTEDRSFADLGGDSLSYVEMSLRLERALGDLPHDWASRPVRDLRPAKVMPRLWHKVETGVLLRAIAIVLVVATHVDLFDLSGGAHVLLAIAGFNLARFGLSAPQRRERVRALVRSALRIAVPSAVWIAFATTVTDDYGLPNVLLLNGVLGPDTWTPAWHFWFVEALLALVLGTAALLAVPALDRLERRLPFVVPLALVGVGLVLRYGVVGPGTDAQSIHTVAGVLWLFALGWATARARTAWQRGLLSAVLLVGLVGYFTDPRRGAFVAVGVLALLWLPQLRVPAPLLRPVAVLARSSLYVYLTHWLIYPPLEAISPPLALLASFAVGISYWRLAETGTRAMTRITAGKPVRRPRRLVRLP